MTRLSICDRGPAAPCPAPFNMAAHVLAKGQATPDKVALAILGLGRAERWSYARLEAAVRGTATGLMQAGLVPGDVVLMRLGNTVEFPLAYLGAIARRADARAQFRPADRARGRPADRDHPPRRHPAGRRRGLPGDPTAGARPGGAAGDARPARRRLSHGRSGSPRLYRLHLRHLRYTARRGTRAPRHLGATDDARGLVRAGVRGPAAARRRL